jgi:hypothetical protein
MQQMIFLTESYLKFQFVYPPEFKRVVELGLINFHPWEILVDDRVFSRYEGLKKRYPKRKLIPFAQRRDCDDVACWDLNNGNKPVIIHDYASVGFELVAQYDTFWDWFRDAMEDMIDFTKEEIGQYLQR